MKTCCKTWTVALVCVLGACVDSKCPKGSREIDGVCMTIDAGAGGDGGPEGLGGTGGSAPQAGADADAGDLGSSDAAVDGGQGAAPPLRCEDLDCDADAHCDDSGTDARCVCDDGYEGDGESCADVDECDQGSHDCDAHAECTNTPGGFSCECEPGYEGDGTSCEENPCEPRVDPCDADNSTCRVEDGEAVCDCMDGRGSCEGDPHACETDLTNDEDHCGACDAACAGNLACEEGACEQPVLRLDLGAVHSCALAPDGEILCWGKNDYGQLARAAGSVAATYEPTVTKHGAARSLSAGNEATCALLKEDDELVCFGYNALYWIDSGAGPYEFSLGTGLTDLDAVEVGTVHACVQGSGYVHAWGVNNYEVLGPGATTTAFAMRIERSDDAAVVAAGLGDCAIGSDERVRCWGNEVEVATEIVDASDEPIENVRDIAVSLGTSTSCAAVEDGRALCWGDNQDGQLGNVVVIADSSAFAVPVTDELGTALTGLVEVAVGVEFACARHEDGRVFCWGRRDRLGNGATGTTAQRYATAVSDVDDAIEIAAGGNHACVRRRSGQVQCWGDNTHGQLGMNPSPGGGGAASAPAPVDVLGLP